MDDEILVDRLRGVVARVVGPARVPAGAGADTPMADGGLWLDSVELLQVVLASEVEFGIVVTPGEDLVGDGLATLGTLAALVRTRRASAATPGAPAPSR